MNISLVFELMAIIDGPFIGAPPRGGGASGCSEIKKNTDFGDMIIKGLRDLRFILKQSLKSVDD